MLYKSKEVSMKKLFTLFSLLLILAALIAVPKTVSASGSCPLPGSSAQSYCMNTACEYDNPGSFGYNECVISCESALYFEANQYCSQYGICCSY